MRIFTLILRIGATLLGCYGLLSELRPEPDAEDRILGMSLALIFTSAGIALFVLTLRRYQGGWLTVLGTGALMFTLGCTAAKVNQHLVASYQAAFGFPVILVSGIAAFVLLLLGHRRHRKLSTTPNEAFA